MLKNISAVFTVARKFNHLVCDVFHIVENIFLVNGWLTSCLLFVNCLYESQQVVCKEFLVKMFCKDIFLLMMLTSCLNVYKDIILLLRCLMWFIICKRVVEMIINNDMNLLRIWLALLNCINKLFASCKHAPKSF